MEAYTGFASVYDLFMDNIPYRDWCDYVTSLLKEYGVTDGLVLDLGCGTGKLTRLLAKKGYDMIGVDLSEEMLEIALEHEMEEPQQILYLQQDMREFELYGTVGAVFSICDSLNYITEPEELKQVFRWVNNYLDPGGIFIFDFNTEYKYREVLGDQTIAESREDCSFIWDNYYYEEERINEYELNLFIREDAESETEGDLYRRFRETHFQRAYTLEEITRIVEESGLQFVTAYEAFTKEPPSKNSERIYVIAREQGKVPVKKAE